jgi:hypothetical protein
MSNEVQITIKTSGAQEAQTVALNLANAMKASGEQAKQAGKNFLESSREGITSLNAWLEVGQKWKAGFQQAFNIMKTAADFQNQANAVGASVRKIGIDFDYLMATTRKASFNMVDDMALLKANSKALQMGVTTDVGKLGELWTIAKNKADILGKSTAEVFEQMTSAIGRGQEKILIELGLLPESFGRSANAADLLKNRVKLLETVLSQGKKEIVEMGGMILSTADKIAQMESAITNLKFSFRELLPAISPIVQGFTEIIRVATQATTVLLKLAQSDFSTFKADPYSKMTAGQLTQILQQKQREIISRQLSEGVPAGVPGYRAPAPGRSLELETRATQNEIAQIEKALQKVATTELNAVKSAVMDFGNQWKNVFGSVIPTFSDKAQKSAKSSLGDIRKETERTNKAFKDLEDQAIKGFAGQLGETFIPTIENASSTLWDAAAAAAGFGRGLKEGLTDIGSAEQAIMKLDKQIRSAAFGKQFTLEDATPEEATKGFLDMFGFGQLMRGELKKVDVAKELKTEKNDIAKAFSDALLQGVRSGNYLDALKQGLRSAVTESFQQKFPVFNQAGQFSVQNFGVNMAAGYATNKLFGEGGIFGSRVIHGQEQIGVSSSINDQVKQAMAERDRILVSAIGLSSETHRQLQDLQFSMTSVVANKSGDGIFSKKTTTYETVGQAAAQENLDKFLELTAKAQLEVAAREFSKGMALLKDPATALEMTITDLQQAVAKLGNSAEGYEAKLQLAQAAAAKAEMNKQAVAAELQRLSVVKAENISTTSAWLQLGLQSGSPSTLETARRYIEQGETPDPVYTARGTPILTQKKGQPIQEISKGFTYSSDPGVGKNLMMDEYLKGARVSFDLEEMGARAENDPAAMVSYLNVKKTAVEQQLSGYKDLMATIQEKLKSKSTSDEDAVRLFEQLKASTTAYYTARSDLRSIDIQMADIAKNQDLEAAQKAEEARQQAEEAQRQQAIDAANARQSRITDASRWLNFASSNTMVLGDITQADFLRSRYASGQYSAGDPDIARQISIIEQNRNFELDSRRLQISARLDPENMKSVWEAQLRQSRNEEAFFGDILERTKQLALDTSIDIEERTAALDRINAANQAYLAAKLKGLEIEAEMNSEIMAEQERIKAQQERITQDALANLSLAIGELATTSRGTEVLILSGESRSAKIRDISRILMDSGAGITPEVKAALDALVNSAEVNGSYEASFRL